MMMGAGFLGMVSLASSFGAYLYRDTICSKYPTLTFFCPTPTQPPTDPPVTETPAPTSAAVGGGSNGGSNTSSTSLSKRFSPYVLLSNSTLGLVGTKSKWTTLAFVVGYSNGKIQWDAGAVDASKLKAKIDAVKKTGGGVLVSFGGQGAGSKGTKYLSELAGKYTDPQKLADAYLAIANALGSTWLDFDVEGAALKDTSAIDRRNKALYLPKKKKSDIRISFTVPVGLNGLDSNTKTMLNKVKNASVKIDLVNIMTMYFTTPTSAKPTMSAAVLKAVAASKPFVSSLGAKLGITAQIGKNPDKPYTHEHFTTGDATRLITSAKGDADVALVSFWSLNNDSSKHSGTYTKAFKAYS